MLAAKGIFAKLLYARGMNFETLVAARALLAIPGFGLIALLSGGLGRLRDASARDLFGAVAAGLLCYYFGAAVNFYALTLIDASLERALLFSYPSLVVIATWLLSGKRPGAVVFAAVIATYLGIALTVGVHRQDLLQQNLTGGLLTLVCAATIAWYFLVSARLTQRLGSAGFTVVAMTAAGLALAAHYQLRHGWQHLQLDATNAGLLLVMVVFVTVLPLYLVAEGVRRVGAQRAAVASTVGPPATALMAFAVLGEVLAPGQLLGIALIVGGILLLELRRTI